ncbi:uncharacterized protein LOC113009157 isoform X2 [Astatotilapia calliptera]|nr:uncharacterized protein LOC113009142 isoform X3 [Astatotilapia calliptera]XP_026003099.1 uncharacterized protein LOC113009157 isoform X2 [Astatotilapia calliptera]
MSDYLVGVAGPNSIGISSLKSLFDQTNISDEVIDGLIYLQCENFPHIYPIPSQITGKILDGSTRAQSAYFLKKNIFQMYEKLIGACLENGSHWTLFFCDIPKRTIVYMNSFGESEVRKSAVLKNWSSFASARGCAGEWTLSHVSHPHQQDGNSCGVHVIMFAQSLIDGKTQVEEYNTEITKLRSRLCHYLFSSIDRTRKCSQCWCVIAAKDRVQCQKCGAYKHMRCSKSVCGICIFCETQCSTAEGKELCSIVGGYTGGAIEVASEECHQGKHQAANDKGKVPKGENICSKSTSNSEIGRLTVRDEGTQTEDKEKETEVYGTSLSTDNAAADDVDRIDADTEFQTDSEGTSTVYRVHGRLSVPSSKKKTYTITEDEIKRRINAENMSVHVFRGLIGGRKAKLPAMILDRPKKAKTKVTVFSVLSEEEAGELALGFAGRLACDVTTDMVCKGIDHSSADMTKQTLLKIQHNLKHELTDSSTFSLLTHTFGPAALDSVISFLCEKLDLVS